MKIKVLREFKDLKENKFRRVGDVFEVSKERFEEIDKTLREKYLDEKWIEELKEEKKTKTKKGGK